MCCIIDAHFSTVGLLKVFFFFTAAVRQPCNLQDDTKPAQVAVCQCVSEVCIPTGWSDVGYCDLNWYCCKKQKKQNKNISLHLEDGLGTFARNRFSHSSHLLFGWKSEDQVSTPIQCKPTHSTASSCARKFLVFIFSVFFFFIIGVFILWYDTNIWNLNPGISALRRWQVMTARSDVHSNKQTSWVRLFN